MSRQIKDIKDKNTGLLIYPRTHSQAIYMSDGSTVESTFNLMNIKIEGCAKAEDIPSLDGYAKESDLLNILFSSLQNNPINEDDSGEFSITDGDGNVGLKLNSDGIYVLDVTAGDHKLSNKLDSLVSGENIKTINGESLIGNGDIIIMGGNVILTVTTADASYPLLFAPAGQTATTTTESFFNTGIYANASTKSLYATHFYETSDKLFKDNIQPILNSDNCPEIKQFNWKENGQQSYGFIAQELEELGYKELVSTDETGKKTVNYSAALSLVVGKMSAKILELELKIVALESKLN